MDSSFNGHKCLLEEAISWVWYFQVCNLPYDTTSIVGIVCLSNEVYELLVYTNSTHKCANIIAKQLAQATPRAWVRGYWYTWTLNIMFIPVHMTVKLAGWEERHCLGPLWLRWWRGRGGGRIQCWTKSTAGSSEASLPISLPHFQSALTITVSKSWGRPGNRGYKCLCVCCYYVRKHVYRHWLLCTHLQWDIGS